MKRKRYNPELRVWRGLSYKKGGQRKGHILDVIRNLEWKRPNEDPVLFLDHVNAAPSEQG